MSPTVGELLRHLDLGSSVAESDAALERYFVETKAFEDLCRDRGDVVTGDKGTGKTALFRILRSRYRSIPELKNVEVIAAFNPVGNPVFQRIREVDPPLEEGEYIGLWKAYVFALVGNWILDLYNGEFSEDMKTLESLLTKTGLNSADDTAETVFSQLINRLRALAPKRAKVAMTFTQQGIPILLPEIEFAEESGTAPEPIRHEEALGLIERILASEDFVTWLVLDRLDEAFQGFPSVEVPALRALLRTYLDLQAFPHIRLKLFLRNDLFRKIAAGGFVNLSHVSARRVEIEWDDNNLYALLCRRMGESKEFVSALGGDLSHDALFRATFPEQVDVGENRPTTWNWMLTRIQDGNRTRPPRNLIDLVRDAQAAQLRKEERSPRSYTSGLSLIEGETLKRGLEKMSSRRVEDTVLAESGSDAVYIERFRGGKAEHSTESIAKVLNMSQGEALAITKRLVENGFLEVLGEGYRIPFLFRDGLNVTQGKAF